MAVGIIHPSPDLYSLLEHDPERALGEFRRVQDLEIDRADLDLLALAPDEVAAEDFGMQRADEDAEPPQRQAGCDQMFADVGDHLGGARRGPGAVDQPIGDALELGGLHRCICR